MKKLLIITILLLLPAVHAEMDCRIINSGSCDAHETEVIEFSDTQGQERHAAVPWADTQGSQTYDKKVCCSASLPLIVDECQFESKTVFKVEHETDAHISLTTMSDFSGPGINVCIDNDVSLITCNPYEQCDADDEILFYLSGSGEDAHIVPDPAGNTPVCCHEYFPPIGKIYTLNRGEPDQFDIIYATDSSGDPMWFECNSQQSLGVGFMNDGEIMRLGSTNYPDYYQRDFLCTGGQILECRNSGRYPDLRPNTYGTQIIAGNSVNGFACCSHPYIIAQQRVWTDDPYNEPACASQLQQLCTNAGGTTLFRNTPSETCCGDGPNEHVIYNSYGTGLCCESADSCIDTGSCVNPATASPESSCSNGIDDDCDGLTDCEDPDCAGKRNSNGRKCCTPALGCNDYIGSCERVECEAMAGGGNECVVYKDANECNWPSISGQCGRLVTDSSGNPECELQYGAFWQCKYDYQFDDDLCTNDQLCNQYNYCQDINSVTQGSDCFLKYSDCADSAENNPSLDIDQCVPHGLFQDCTDSTYGSYTVGGEECDIP